MDVDAVVQRCMRSRYIQRAIQAAGRERVEAMLREELSKRQKTLDRRPTDAMSAAMAAMMRRAREGGEQCGNREH